MTLALGPVPLYWRYEGGRAVDAGRGSPDADLSLALSAADAATLLSGELSPCVLFMRGRLKASGDGGLLLKVLESTLDSRFGEWLQEVRSSGTAAVP